jgi:hypothetical protein
LYIGVFEGTGQQADFQPGTEQEGEAGQPDHSFLRKNVISPWMEMVLI